MRYAGIEVGVGAGFEAKLTIELQCMGLCRQGQTGHSGLLGMRHDGTHQYMPQPLAPSRNQQGHATDAAIGKQPCGAYRLLLQRHQKMRCAGIFRVPFQFWRNLLLVDEYGLADAAQRRSGVPVCDADLYVTHRLPPAADLPWPATVPAVASPPDLRATPATAPHPDSPDCRSVAPAATTVSATGNARRWR